MAHVHHTPGFVATTNAYGPTPVRFFVHNPQDVIQSHHASGQFYELEELAIIERHFPRGGVYLDVGSNVGNHLIFVAASRLSGGMIAVEPNLKSIEILVLNLLLNGLLGVVDTQHLGVGLSDAESRAEANTRYANNLGDTLMEEKPDGAIRLVTGDSLFGDRKIDFIKIDVEGHEMKALAGLGLTIARNRPVMFVEVDERNAGAFEQWLALHRYEVAERFKRYANNENFLIRPLDPPATAPAPGEAEPKTRKRAKRT